MNSRPRGFTLVEVLVVLAVLAALTAILLPVFYRVRENGRETACKANLHQIGLALQQYTNDNNGVYPPVVAYTLAQPKWSDLIQPYLKSSRVFDCFSHSQRHPDQNPNSTIPTPGHTTGFDFTGNYRYNFNGIRNPGGRFGGDKFEALIPDPEHTSLVSDAGWIDPDRMLHYLQPVATDRITGDINGRLYQFSVHGEGANFVFADGHVKWLSVQQQENKEWYVGGYAAAPGDP